MVLKNIAEAYLIPGQLHGGVCGGRKVVAFAITLTKEGNHMDGAVVLAASIGGYGILLLPLPSPPLPSTPLPLLHRTPYVITQFFFTCSKGQYVLLLFLLVEASTVPLNAMAFLEDLGRRRSTAHRCGVTFTVWVRFQFRFCTFVLGFIWFGLWLDWIGLGVPPYTHWRFWKIWACDDWRRTNAVLHVPLGFGVGSFFVLFCLVRGFI